MPTDLPIQSSARRILIIEDEQAIREVIRACLEDVTGWQIDTAASGEAGVQQAQQRSPDVILLDVSMPEQDGLVTLEQLQNIPALCNVPIILMTARVQPQDRAQFAVLNIAGVIEKPFDPLTLGEQIKALLGWLE